MQEYTVTSDGKVPVVAVVGPTASGKTDLAIAIAQHFGGEVVSADSMQIYRGMDIATAKPTPAEMQGIPHHLIGFQEPENPFSVAEYAALAHAAIREVLDRGKLPVLAGGTGLYVDSVLHDLRFSEIRGDEQLRAELVRYAQEYGNPALWERLRSVDPETAAALHPNNLGRVIRAIEVYRETGVTMAEHQRRSRGRSRYAAVKIGLNCRDREWLYDRINRRVDRMLERGLLEEAREFRERSAVYGMTAVQAIGYKELDGYFDGTLALAEAVENLKRSTRQYAKRQLTWFRKDPAIHWFYPDEEEMEILRKKVYACIEKSLAIWYD